MRHHYDWEAGANTATDRGRTRILLEVVAVLGIWKKEFNYYCHLVARFYRLLPSILIWSYLTTESNKA